MVEIFASSSDKTGLKKWGKGKEEERWGDRNQEEDTESKGERVREECSGSDTYK